MARKLRLFVFVYARIEAVLASYKCGTRAASYPNLVYVLDTLLALITGG